ncbi:hypothetical protein KP77_25490 [Jeotgalibacillus alimentarius]|uniref:Helix-turn-helix domain-containing protein n=1 Tax=Jeotgalibacillus alimentarius TaxID=135826 RepID=A0A0C2R9I1_9BACL|nr:hypothetical protein [Jeotgalibacillus alimentarius]KIL46980.1 hypothetical protein KP77_25490 [Jeotgalibacillus alimentarius]
MLKVELDIDQLQKAVNDAIDKGFERHAVKQGLPELLTRNQLKEILGIGDTKASELLNRADFPVLRAAGSPKVPKKQLFQWIDENTKWIRQHGTYLDDVI